MASFFKNIIYIRSAWFRISMPFIGLICGMGLFMGYVPDEELEFCTGKVENLQMTGRAKYLYLLRQSNMIFGIENCKHPVLGLESVGLFHNPAEKIAAELDTDKDVSVWFTKDQSVDVNTKLVRRIVIGGKVVFDYPDFIHLFGALFYPVLFFMLLWLYSILRLMLEGKSEIPFSSTERKVEKDFQHSVTTTMKVFMTESAMLSALRLESGKNPQIPVAAWFPDMKKKLLDKTGIQAHMVDELPAPANRNRHILVAGIHPSARKEQIGFERAGIQYAVVFLSLEDPLLKSYMDDNFNMMKGLGLKEDEAISDSLVGQSVAYLQKDIDERVSSDLPAASSEEWLLLNKG